MKVTIDDKQQEVALAKLTEAEKVERIAEKVTIDSHADYTHAASCLLDVKERMRALEDKQDEVAKPLAEALAQVKAWFAPVLERYAAIERRLKEELAGYAAACEEKADAQIVKAQKVAKLDPGKARSMLSGAETLLVPKVGGISYRSKIAFEVVDEKAIPESFWTRTLNDDMVIAALKAGDEVPGVVKVRESSVAVTPAHRRDKVAV